MTKSTERRLRSSSPISGSVDSRFKTRMRSCKLLSSTFLCAQAAFTGSISGPGLSMQLSARAPRR